MVAFVFDSILRKAQQQGIAPGVKRASRDWFRKQAQQVSSGRANPTRMIRNEPERLVRRPMIGSMYLFNYDPKYKKTLPYYDRYPLIFPVGGEEKFAGYASQGGAFYGLNVHYLPPPLRARLMDALYTTTNNKAYDQTTRMRVSYQILQSASKYRFFKPCFKKYLVSHVKSQFLKIEPNEWDVALFLPTERFVGASLNRVYKDSRNRI